MMIRKSRALSLALALLAAVSISVPAQTPPAPSGAREPPSYQPPSADAKAPGAEAAKEPASSADAKAQGAEAAKEPAAEGPLAPLEWLAGCWQNTVNQRELREQWLPLRGGMLIGAAQQVSRGRMQDYEFLRIESRADGVYFSQFSGDRKEASFRLSDTKTDDKDTVFTFTNTVDAFPQRLVYRRGIEGWLYETIEGTLNGSERKVIYPMRRVDCESAELIFK